MAPAEKKSSIHQIPNVLILTLKRFADSFGGKISNDVKYPQSINIRPYTSEPNGESIMYTLYAVLIHSGDDCSEGHYYSYIKASNGLWHHMNDSDVSMSNLRTVLGQQAYVLFYIRTYKELEARTVEQHHVSQHPLCSPERDSYRQHRSTSCIGQCRSAAKQTWSPHRHSHSGHTKKAEKHSPRKEWWGRHCPKIYTPYTLRKLIRKHQSKDSSWTRRDREPAAGVRQLNYSHSSQAGALTSFPLHFECYYEKPASRARKRKYEDEESDQRAMEKTGQITLPSLLEEPKENSSKSSKKKKITEDKHQELEYRHQLDPGVPKRYSDADLRHKKRKKRHSGKSAEDSTKEPAVYLPKVSDDLFGNPEFFCLIL